MAIIVLYVLFARCGLLLSFTDGRVSPIWPPSGLAVAVMMMGGRRYLPALISGGILAVTLEGRLPWMVVAGFMAANIGEYLLARLVLRSGAPDCIQLETLGDLLWLLLVAVVAPLVSALMATGTLWLSGLVDQGGLVYTFATWWAGNSIGILLFAPALFVVGQLFAGTCGLALSRLPELLLLAGISAVVTLVLFAGVLPSQAVDPVMVYLIFPFLVWGAIRFGVPGAVLVVILTLVLAVVMTVHGYGPFVRPDQTFSLILLDSFMAVASMMALVPAVVLRQRDRTSERYRLLSTAVEQSATAVVVTAADGKISYINPAFSRLTGYTAEEVEGRNPRFLNSGFMEATAFGEMWKTILAGRTWRGEFLNRCKDGTLAWEQATISPVRDSSSEIVSFVCTAEDVTDRKRNDEALKGALATAERAKGELERIAYAVTHTLQEPLRTISGFAQLLMRRYSEVLDDTALGYLQRVVHGTDKMHHLFQDLMHYVLVDEGGVSQSVDLNAAVSDAVSATGSDGVAEFTLTSLPVVRGNERQLRHVFGHLFANSLKFRCPGRPLAIEVSAERLPAVPGSPRLSASGGDVWVVAVSDNGIGIDPEFHPRLFTLFSRLNASEQYEGTGVGLAYCRRVIEHHGGRIWIESDGKSGVRILFTLPGGPAVKETTVQ